MKITHYTDGGWVREAEVDIFEPNDYKETAVSTNTSQSYQASFTNTIDYDDIDYFKLDVMAGKTYTILTGPVIPRRNIKTSNFTATDTEYHHSSVKRFKVFPELNDQWSYEGILLNAEENTTFYFSVRGGRGIYQLSIREGDFSNLH